MKNLAGDANCDRYIADELRRSMIPSVPYEGKLTEVPSRLRGKLGPFEFWRAWYYWVIHGPLPLAIAHELYEDPIGRADVRVDGHCGCPPPETPWIHWYTTDGKKVLDLKQKEEWDGLQHSNSEIMRQIFEKNYSKYAWSDDPASIGATAYVDCYHIDSEAGLRLFCDAVRRHKLDKMERPSWWRRD